MTCGRGLTQLRSGNKKTVAETLITRWPRMLLEDKSWAFVDAPLPGMRPLRLERVWTELGLAPALLEARTRTEPGLRSVQDRSYVEQPNLRDQWDAEPIGTVLERLRRSLLVVARPGSGKTTLLKWTARYLVTNRESRFKFPMYVSLRSYALRKRQKPDLSITDFFCQTCGLDNEAQWKTWRHLLSWWMDAPRWRSDLRNTALLLLDGWDEVPFDYRDLVKQAIEDAMQVCPAIISSRPSGFPASLGAEQVCYIAGLSNEGIDQLLRNYFSEMTAGGQEDLVRNHLDTHPDLWRLARNPFLLTLLAAIVSRHGVGGKNRLPTTRFQLYRQTIGAIYEHHNLRYPEAPFSLRRRRQAQELAIWLMEDAPASPTYVFTADDVTIATRDSSWFEPVLSRSRLVSSSPEDEHLFRFMHGTFQEFLAAQALLTADGKDVASRVQRRMYDAAWLEVMRFAAGLAEPDVTGEFWQQLAKAGHSPDRFGLVYVRLARFAAEARSADGGRELLKIDLRDKLWEAFHREDVQTNELFVTALIDLDPEYCVERAEREFREGRIHWRTYVNILAQSPRRLVSARLFELIMSGEDEIRPEVRDLVIEHAALGLAEPERARLRSIASDEKGDIDQRTDALNALGASRDYASVPVIEQIAYGSSDREDSWEVTQMALDALGQIGGRRATDALIRLWGRASNRPHNQYIAEQIISALGLATHVSAQKFLLRELASRPSNDPMVLNILHALWGVPIWNGGAVVADILVNSDDADMRAAAARALTECTDLSVRGALLHTAQNDPKKEVREAAMEALLGWLEPGDLSWLVGRSAAGKERDLALQLLVVLGHSYGHGPEGRGILEATIKAVASALRRPRGRRAQVAALHAHLLGTEMAERLLAVCSSSEAQISVRQNAIQGLDALHYKGAVAYFVSLLCKYPDVDARLRKQSDASEASLVPDAAKALAHIEPTKLLEIKGLAARQALSEFSITTGHLVFADHILDPAGRRVLNQKPDSGKGNIMTIENADVAIVIALKEEFDELYPHIRNAYIPIPDEETGRSFYAFQRPGPTGTEPYKCVAIFAGEMGPEAASLVTRRLIDASRPATVVNLGICAGRRGDVNIGDVVIATQVKLYAEAVKVRDSSFEPAGRDFDTNQDLIKRLENLVYTHADQYKQWRQGCRRRFGRIRPRDQRLKLLEGKLLSSESKEIPGPLASGPFVNQSVEFFRWILNQNRKIIAMEMEAGGVMKAIRERVEPARSLILRAVSDYGDQTKKRFDKLGSGALRRYAMQNAISLLWIAIESGLLPRTKE